MNIIDDNTLSFQPKLIFGTSKKVNILSMDNDISIYIHIPFCERKCYFCSIDTCQSFSSIIINKYVDALVQEIELYTDFILKLNVICVHFGGGTPSILNQYNLKKILLALSECIPNLKEKEIIFEANPLSLDIEKVLLIADFSKLSLNIGIQTFDKIILDSINRNVNINRVKQLIVNTSKLNIYTIGIDLMCNLPKSNKQTTINDIDIALGLGVNHFSIYPFRLEINSVFYKKYNKIYKELPSVCQQYKSFEIAINQLISMKFDRYSIFHFNDTGHINQLYSRYQIFNGEWIGFGSGANSYYRNQIVANTSDINEYIHNYNQKEIMTLSKTDIITREIVYSLRRGEINKEYYIERYGNQIYDLFTGVFLILQKKKYILETEEKFILTTQGIFDLPLIETIIYEYIEQK